jgi:hypothetical protein
VFALPATGYTTYSSVGDLYRAPLSGGTPERTAVGVPLSAGAPTYGDFVPAPQDGRISADGTLRNFWRSGCVEEHTGNVPGFGMVTRCVRSRHTLVVAAVPSGAEREVETFEAAGRPEAVSWPVFSPSGRHVAYAYAVGGDLSFRSLALYVRAVPQDVR